MAWVEERLAAFGRVVAEIRRETPGPAAGAGPRERGHRARPEGARGQRRLPGVAPVRPRAGGAPRVDRDAPRSDGGLDRPRRAPRRSRRARATATAGAASPRGRPGSARCRSATRTPSSFPKTGQKVRVGGREAPVLSVSLEHAVVDVTDVDGRARGRAGASPGERGRDGADARGGGVGARALGARGPGLADRPRGVRVPRRRCGASRRRCRRERNPRRRFDRALDLHDRFRGARGRAVAGTEPRRAVRASRARGRG